MDKSFKVEAARNVLIIQIDSSKRSKNFNVKNYFNEDTFETDLMSLL